MNDKLEVRRSEPLAAQEPLLLATHALAAHTSFLDRGLAVRGSVNRRRWIAFDTRPGRVSAGLLGALGALSALGG